MDDLINIVYQQWSNANIAWLREHGPTATGDAIKASMPKIFREVVGPYLQMIQDINTLRAQEGDSVEILCDNPEPDSPEDACAVEVCGDWTGWKERRFKGRTIGEALRAAVSAVGRVE